MLRIIAIILAIILFSLSVGVGGQSIDVDYDTMSTSTSDTDFTVITRSPRLTTTIKTPTTQPPQNIQAMLQVLQKRVDLINITLGGHSKKLANLTNQQVNTTKQITTLVQKKISLLQQSVDNLSARLDNLDAASSSSTPPPPQMLDERVTALEENLADVMDQVKLLRSKVTNSTATNQQGGGMWVYNYSYWVKGSGGWSASCNCGRTKTSIMFG